MKRTNWRERGCPSSTFDRYKMSDIPAVLAPWMEMLQRVYAEHAQQAADMQAQHAAELQTLAQKIESDLRKSATLSSSASTLLAATAPAQCTNCDELRQKVVELNERYEAEKRVSDLRAEQHNELKSALEQDLQQAWDALEHAAVREKALTTTLDAMESQAVASEQAIAELSQHYTKAQSLLLQLVDEHKKLQDAHSHLQAQKTSADRSIENLRSELSETKTRLQHAYSDRDRLMAQQQSATSAGSFRSATPPIPNTALPVHVTQIVRRNSDAKRFGI